MKQGASEDVKLKSFLGIQGTRGMRLKDANIVKIENVDLNVQAKYLSS